MVQDRFNLLNQKMQNTVGVLHFLFVSPQLYDNIYVENTAFGILQKQLF